MTPQVTPLLQADKHTHTSNTHTPPSSSSRERGASSQGLGTGLDVNSRTIQSTGGKREGAGEGESRGPWVQAHPPHIRKKLSPVLRGRSFHRAQGLVGRGRTPGSNSSFDFDNFDFDSQVQLPTIRGRQQPRGAHARARASRACCTSCCTSCCFVVWYPGTRERESSQNKNKKPRPWLHPHFKIQVQSPSSPPTIIH